MPTSQALEGWVSNGFADAAKCMHNEWLRASLAAHPKFSRRCLLSAEVEQDAHGEPPEGPAPKRRPHHVM